MFLDGVVPYTLGCHKTDVNCTSAGCKPTPQPSGAALEAEWTGLYAAWFAALKAKHPKLVTQRFPFVYTPRPVRYTLYMYGDLTGRGVCVIGGRWA